ncbi:MAG TPA: polysaccharide biosynthesis tyrosine autokinase [Terriglobales bacterium]|nr:polysaccharide biosynthesis tyrosine autokinase [Terriglobales bacterium]
MNRDDNIVSSRVVTIPVRGGGGQEEEHSFAAMWQTIVKRRWIVIGTTALIFTLIAVHTFRTKPVYESVMSLQIDPGRSSNLGLDDVLNERIGVEDVDTRMQTEVKLIQSDSVAARVIGAMGLAKRLEFVGKMADSMQQTELKAMSPWQREAMLETFQQALTVRIVPQTQLVEIRFRSTDPKLATDVANAVAEQYMQRNFQAHYEGAVQVSRWLAKQMEELQGKASDAQQKLADFQKNHNILGESESDNITTDRLKVLNQQVTEAEAERIVKEAKHRLAETGDPELIASTIPTPTLQLLRGQEAEMKSQLAQLNSKFGPGYPKVHELQAQLTRLESAIQAEIENVGKRLNEDYLSAAKTESLLRDQFNAQKSAAYKLNEHAVQFSVLKHEVETSQELYDTLQVKLKVAGVTAGLNSSYISVVDPAEIPATPIEPKVRANLAIGLFGGLLTGLLLAFLTESFDDTVSTSSELETFTGLPVLCSIPVNPFAARLKGATEAGKPGATVPMLVNNPRSQAAEAFRGLRTSILLSTPDLQPKVIAVVSSIATEGKTTVAANLGVSFAQRGESVLLIDADLRRSALHSQFGLPYSPAGVSTMLTQRTNGNGIVTPLESLPTLKLLPAGPHPPNPAELLGSKRMGEVLGTYSAEFDRIILDTPPILSVADALALSNLADAVVLVIRSGVARRKAVLRVRDLLQRSQANLVGIVFNCVNLKLENYYGYSQRYGKAMSHYYRGNDEEAAG